MTVYFSILSDLMTTSEPTMDLQLLRFYVGFMTGYFASLVKIASNRVLKLSADVVRLRTEYRRNW